MTARIALLLTLAFLACATTASAAERIVQFDPAKTSRADLMHGLDGLGLRSITLRKLPFAVASGDATALRRAARLPGVVRTRPNERLELELAQSGNLVFGGAAKRDALYAAGLDGSGQNVALIDSGVDGLHPDLTDHVVKNVKIVGVDGVLDEIQGVFSTPIECPVACNTDTSSGHGTHVASIMAGTGAASDGLNRGMAPGAGIVSIGVGDAVAIFHALQGYDYLLAHPELNVAAVNNSYGPSGGGRLDATSPVAIGTKALHDAGITVVFSGGNSGVGGADGSDPNEPVGSSDCSPTAASDACKSNPNGIAPWAISVGAIRKDHDGGIGDQPLTFFSARGDDDPQRSVDGSLLLNYGPTLVAPGMNVRAARTPTGAAVGTGCVGNDPLACIPDRPEYEAFYAPSSGTSMAAPHVTGAIAVIQDAAQTRLGRRLTPDEVKALLVKTATPLTKIDALWDFPCGDITPCGGSFPGTTGKAYERWQVGAGALSLGRAVDAVASLPKRPAKKPKKKIRG